MSDFNLKELQELIDVLAESMNVPVALIMGLTDKFIEVKVSSNTENNPYNVGDKEIFDNSGLYCEYVIKSKEMLKVPNALKDDKWKNNPDIKLNLISYLGFPIRLPDGNIYGTICVLDSKENNYSDKSINLLKQFRNFVEQHLKFLTREINKTKISTFKATCRTLNVVVNKTLNNISILVEKIQSGEKLNEDELKSFNSLLYDCSKELKTISNIDNPIIETKYGSNMVKI